MPASNPRVNVVLEPPLYHAIERLAHRDKVSLSTKMRDLVREALEVAEDIALTDFADRRARSFHRRTALPHDRVWRRRPR